MELTQGRLHHLLENLSLFIQTFLFLLGILLIITPLAWTFSHHDWAHLSSTPRPTTPLQLKCHHLYKRFCHYSHMWILVALEELGLFGLLDTLFCWLPLTNDDNSDQQDDDEAHFPGTSPNADDTHQRGSQRHPIQQISLNHQLANVCIRGPENKQEDPLLVSGLVNTGNTCYLNSVLQALSSLPRLQLYLDGINSQYTSQHLPVTRSLYKTLRLLSRPLLDELNTKNLAFRPVDIVSAVNVNHRVINREQQDAHELFQLLSGALETEGLAATKGCHVDNGLKGLLSPYDSKSSSPGATTITTTTTFRQQQHPTMDSSSSVTTCFTTTDQHNTKLQHNNPLTGLLANRLSCTKCGYTEAIRHFSFNNIQLTLPQTASTTLDDCLEQLTAMEYLDDVSCRKCSMDDMVQRMGLEVERLQQQVKLCDSDKQEIISTLVNVEMQRRDLVHQLSVGIIEDNHLKKMAVPYQVQCGPSTKQVMLAKPPKVLCLHISRSTFHPTTGVIYKNKCQLEFPEYLDMDRFCTNGTLITAPDQPISLQQQQQVNDEAPPGGVKYKLMSIIVHYGSHSCGHFIAYKRRVVANDCGCEKCGSTSQEDCVLRSSDTWYRISDENVDVCTMDEVLLANPYMLLYESIDPPSPSILSSSNNNSDTWAALSTTARILVSTERNTTDERHPVTMVKSVSSSSLSSTSTALSSSSSSSVTTLPTSPSPSNSTDLLAESPSPSSSSSSSYTSQKHHHQQHHHHHIGSSHLVHRNKDRRKLDWQESAPPLVIY
ncbi:unnamed protein product [Absidia cylindrospora]